MNENSHLLAATDSLRFKSGLPTFDKVTGGLKPGMLVCVHGTTYRDFGMTVALTNTFSVQTAVPVLVLTSKIPLDEYEYRELLLYGGTRSAASHEWGADARAGRLVPAVPWLLPLLPQSAAAASRSLSFA